MGRPPLFADDSGPYDARAAGGRGGTAAGGASPSQDASSWANYWAMQSDLGAARGVASKRAAVKMRGALRARQGRQALKQAWAQQPQNPDAQAPGAE